MAIKANQQMNVPDFGLVSLDRFLERFLIFRLVVAAIFLLRRCSTCRLFVTFGHRLRMVLNHVLSAVNLGRERL